MSDYRRSYIPGGTYFFTVVTLNRQPLLTLPESRTMLQEAWINVQERFPFTIEAVCLLPEHIHCIWTLPEGEVNYSVRWKEIKRLFSKSYQTLHGPESVQNASRMKRQETAI